MIQTDRSRYIEQAFKCRYDLLMKIGYMICQNHDIAEDCVMEAVTRTLEMSFPITSLKHAQNILCAQVRWTAVDVVRHRNVAALAKKEIYERTLEFVDDTTGISEFYPLANMLKDKFKDLYKNNQIALEAYMYSIPLNEVADLYNVTDGSMRKSLVRGLQQLRDAFNIKKKSLIDNTTNRVIELWKSGLSNPEISRQLHIKVESVCSRIENWKRYH